MACGKLVTLAFFELMIARRVDEAWILADRFARLFREAPERFREDPWNSKMAFILCHIESAGGFFMARMCQYERAIRSCEKALALLRQREEFARSRSEWTGWTQPRCYLVGALGYVKWLSPRLREEVLTPEQLLDEWNTCLEAYLHNGDENKKQTMRSIMILAFEGVMRCALLFGLLDMNAYNVKAQEARRALLVDIPLYPHLSPEELSLSVMHHSHHYSLCFMLEACSPAPQTDRLRAYMDMNYRTCLALSQALWKPPMGPLLKRDCLAEYRIVARRLALRAPAAESASGKDK